MYIYQEVILRYQQLSAYRKRTTCRFSRDSSRFHAFRRRPPTVAVAITLSFNKWKFPRLNRFVKPLISLRLLFYQMNIFNDY